MAVKESIHGVVDKRVLCIVIEYLIYWHYTSETHSQSILQSVTIPSIKQCEHFSTVIVKTSSYNPISYSHKIQPNIAKCIHTLYCGYYQGQIQETFRPRGFDLNIFYSVINTARLQTTHNRLYKCRSGPTVTQLPWFSDLLPLRYGLS